MTAGRLLAFILGIYFAAAGWVLGHDKTVVFFGPVWPWVFAAAGIAAIALAVTLNPRLVPISGTLAMAATLSRAVSLLFAWAGGQITWTRAALGAGTWALFGLYVAYAWARALLPETSRYRAPQQQQRDARHG